MTSDELSAILAKHAAWTRDEDGGERANLERANLEGANLGGANLGGANLGGANLERAYLERANLGGANLGGAYLERANLEGANLERANLRGANLRGAYLERAYLGGVNLGGANLEGAYLGGANLRFANLEGANLRGANLEGANLEGALGVPKERTTPLMMLFDQPGVIHAYKLVKADLTGPYRASITYTIGAEIAVEDANTDDAVHCGAGISVATLDWCLTRWQPGRRILVVAFTAADIACIPCATDGKFRLHRCRVVGEKDITGMVSS